MSKYKKGDLLRWEETISDNDELMVVLGTGNNFAGNRCYKMMCLVDGYENFVRIEKIECDPTITLVARGQ